MAFNAEIDVSVKITKALQGIEKLENRINKIKDTVIDIKLNRSTDGANEFKKLGNSFKRLAQSIKTAGVVTAVAAVTGSLQSLNNLPIIGGGLDTSALGKVVSQLGALSNAAVDAAAAAPLLSAGLVAATVATVAFAPQIARATKDTLLLARAGAEAAVPLKQLTQLLATATVGRAAFGGEQLVDAANFAEIYRQRLFEVSNTVSELTRKQQVLSSTLNQYNSGTDTAAKIAGRLVTINKELNAELREQKDLLRQVSGVNVSELEASKGRNSIETRKKRESFQATQASEELEIQRALQRLEERGASALAEELSINQNIVNTKREELQVENEIQRRVRTAAQRKLTGDRPFGPAGDPQSIQQAGANREKRIRDATATAIEADRKWLQAREQGLIEAAQRGLNAELDAIETTLTAAIKADNAVQANWDARFKARVQAETVREKARLSADSQRARRNKLYAQEEDKIRKKAEDARKTANQRRSRFGEDLALGAGFPLLFGAGPAGIAGGVAGAVAGGGKGGFGLQILLSALGTQLDAFVADLGALGGALTKVEGFLDVATEKLLLSSKAREKELKALQKLGFTDLADSLAKTDLENALGKDAIANLENLSKEFDQFGRTLALLTTSLGAFIAGPLAELLRAINGGNSKDQAVKAFGIARTVEGDKRIEEQGAKTEAQQIKIRQKVVQEYKTTLQKLVKAKQEELNVTTLTNDQKAIVYAQAQKELQRPGAELEGQAGVRTKLQGLSITGGLQANQLQILNIAEKYKNITKKQQEQQENYDRQRVEIIRSYEESIAQTREKVEQRILNLRIQGIQKANAIENQRAANQLSELQAANRSASQQQRESAVSAGTRPEFAATAQTIDDAFRAIAEEELSTEQKKAQIKRDAAFEVLKLELAAEKFKIDVAKEVSQLNLNTARRIERINIGIAKRNKDFNQEKFNIEKEIARTQLEVLEQENILLLLKLKTTTDFIPDNFAFQNFIGDLLLKIEKVKEDLARAKPPGKLDTLAPVGGESVPTEGADVVLQNLIERQRQLTAERLKSLDIIKATNKEAELAKVSQIRIEDEATVNGLLTQQLDSLNAQQRIIELQNEGRSEAQAVAIQQVETTFKLVDGNLAVAEAKLKGQLAALQGLDADKQDLEVIQKVKTELEKIANLRAGLPADQQTAVENAAKLNEGLTETEQIATDIAGTLGNGITDALVLAVSGTEDLGRAFQELASDILAAVGKALILAAVTKAIGAVGSGTTPGTGILGDLFRADGGPVTGNQPYIVGEEGPEMFIPGVSGMISNNDQFEAARNAMSGGSSPGADGSVSSDSAGVSSAFAENTSSITTTNSYMRERSMERSSQTTVGGGGSLVVETQVINNVEYATVEQMQLASAASAKQARAEVFRDLRNKPAARASVGMR